VGVLLDADQDEERIEGDGAERADGEPARRAGRRVPGGDHDDARREVSHDAPEFGRFHHLPSSSSHGRGGHGRGAKKCESAPRARRRSFEMSTLRAVPPFPSLSANTAHDMAESASGGKETKPMQQYSSKPRRMVGQRAIA